MSIMVVVGGNFGSEGKGAVCANMVREMGTLGAKGKIAVVRVAGPNAGHSAVGLDGHKWALRQIPVAAVVDKDVQLVIGAGSEIDEDVLADEIARLDGEFRVTPRLFIDSRATIITGEDRETERSITTGTTGKGIGAARARRLLRQAELWGEMRALATNTQAMLHRWLEDGNHVIIEGTQGFGLGLHSGYYPYTTSSDCRAIDFLAMAGLSPWEPMRGYTSVIIVMRTHPIRIAGASGPLNNELTWEELDRRSGGHIKPEYTTVTKKLRRVGEWDPDLARAAVRANGGPSESVKIALQFFDYWWPELAGETDEGSLGLAHRASIAQVEKDCGAQVVSLGTGPDTTIAL